MTAIELLDRYLLGEPVSKPEVVAVILADRSPVAAAAPFYRALEAVGVRAADEAFIALRLVLAGRTADDGSVRRLRALVALVRAGAAGDEASCAAVLRRDAGVLADMPATLEPAVLGRAAQAAYRSAVLR